MVFCVIVLCFPFFSNLISQLTINREFSSSFHEFESRTEQEKLEYLRQANLYNSKLFKKKVNNENIWPYEEQLSFNSAGIMGLVEIPKINQKLTIYHGTSNAVLMAGAGHLDFTSLPVGGESSHCAISAHSGMAHMKGFDNINHLNIGDKFILWVLNEPYCYEVYDKEVVEPDDLSSLEIEQGRDLVTLITCTPFF